MTIVATQCAFCEHFDLDTVAIDRCTAFPDGIPDEIKQNLIDHRKPVEGDHGIQFVAIEGFTHPLGDGGGPIEPPDPMLPPIPKPDE